MRNLVLTRLVKNWKAPYVARNQVELFSGGLFTAKTLANADSRNEGPEGRIKLGQRKVAYPTESLAKWIADRVSEV